MWNVEYSPDLFLLSRDDHIMYYGPKESQNYVVVIFFKKAWRSPVCACLERRKLNENGFSLREMEEAKNKTSYNLIVSQQ